MLRESSNQGEEKDSAEAIHSFPLILNHSYPRSFLFFKVMSSGTQFWDKIDLKITVIVHAVL